MRIYHCHEIDNFTKQERIILLNEKMATKILAWSLFGCLELLCFVSSSKGNVLDCGPKVVANSYLDIATELIRNAKEAYFESPQLPSKALDCGEIMNNGQNISKVYRIWPKSRVLNGRFVDVFCDMDTDGGGWTVIQRRGNFSRAKDYFFQDWQSYKNGFGKIEEDFWLGNDNIYAMSNQGLYSIRFDMKDVEGNKGYAQYDTFWIDDEDHKYTLHIKGYSGDAGDSMIGSHDNHKFSTKDQDNDASADSSCSQTFKGGWWYSACHSANLNGQYLGGKHESFADGVNWKAWKGYHESLDTTEIKIRQKDFRKQSTATDELMTPE